MKESHIIRAARADEVMALAAIRRDAIIVLSSGALGRAGAQDWAYSAGTDRVHRAIGDHHVYVADLRGDAVGWIEIVENRVEGLYVHPSHSGRGVGGALLLHAEERMNRAGHLFVELDASYNAEGFYMRRGYEPGGKRHPKSGRVMSKHLHRRLPSSV